MLYNNICSARFLCRPNRFIAQVTINGTEETVHVKNTGRCKELLVPNATVYLTRADNPERKTQYDLVAVEKQRNGKPPLLINMDAQAPNYAAEEWLKRQYRNVRKEVTYGTSRFDFYIEDTHTFLEVKGVTLESDGIAMFPDAPTERGVKHIQELISCKKEGYGAAILFVIQMKEISEFRPNDRTHPAFGQALREAQTAGISILAMDCTVTPQTMEIDTTVPIFL